MSYRHQELTSPEQTATGKDFSNPLIVDSLLKTIWSSMHHVFTIKHWTPQQNGVAERKNRTLIEAARTMLADSKLPTTFWAKAVSTACYVQNRVLIVKPHNKTPYELFRGIQGVSESSTSSQQDQDCIVMPIWKDASYFGDAAPRSVADAQIQDKDGLQNENDATKKSHDDSGLKDNGTAVQQVNTARP
ncbi:ribonuclease H-like domain-containing protein [Tanacetum coccineum]